MDILDRITMLLGNREQKELTNYLKLNNVAFSEWKSGKSKSYRKYLIEIPCLRQRKKLTSGTVDR